MGVSGESLEALVFAADWIRTASDFYDIVASLEMR